MEIINRSFDAIGTKIENEIGIEITRSLMAFAFTIAAIFGRSECWGAGADLRDLATAGNWSDRISSIRVLGRAYAVAYRDIGFRGESIIIDRDIPDLAQLSARSLRNWDRQISSLQIENERGFSGTGRGRGNDRPRR